MKLLTALALAFALAFMSTPSCGGPSPTPARIAAPHASAAPISSAATMPPAAPQFPDAAERTALFDDLVAATRRYHLFSEHATKAFDDRALLTL